MQKAYGTICGGFAIIEGKLKFNSKTFNSGKNDDAHDGLKYMSWNEAKLVYGAIINYVISGYPSSLKVSISDCMDGADGQSCEKFDAMTDESVWDLSNIFKS